MNPNKALFAGQPLGAVTSSVSNSRGLKILLVEDNPDEEVLTLQVFEKFGLKDDISVVRDGQEALDYLFLEGTHRHRSPVRLPDIMILDLKLPKVSGLDVVKRIRANSKTQLMPIIIFTSSLEENDLILAYRYGVNSYIKKPVDFKEFSMAIKQLIAYWLLWNETPTVKKE